MIFFDSLPFISRPAFPALLWSAIILILLTISSKKCKAIYSFFLLFVQYILIIGCDYLFLSNGTVFERSMIQQRNDAYAIIEQFYVNPYLLITCIVTLTGYLVFLRIYLKKCSRAGKQMVKYRKRTKAAGVMISFVLLLSLYFIPVSEGMSKATKDYTSILYNFGDSYQNMGITGNFVYEILRGSNSNPIDISNLSEIESAIYSQRCEISDFNGISKGNNLIMILAESFEWYPLQVYSKDLTTEIYPNLSRLMEESVLSSNFYSREKTDTAEALMILGSNPTGKYVHTDFAENTYPYSLPNLFRREAVAEGDMDVAIRSFHQNNGSFYNRNIAHKSFGFDSLTDIGDMKKYGLVYHKLNKYHI